MRTRGRKGRQARGVYERTTRWWTAAPRTLELLEQRRLLSFGHDGNHRHHGIASGGTVEFCPPPPDPRGGRAVGEPAVEEVAPFPLGDTFLLHSRPSASKTIYLDFNGDTTSGTFWNNPSNPTIVTPEYDVDNVAGFSNVELENIQLIWQRVVEDFLPFDVNVTTQEPPVDDLRNTGGGDTRWGIRVDIGGNGAWFGPAGGVAYIGSFTWETDTPTFVFADILGNGDVKYTTEAISHEVGHTLGLFHDGRVSPSEDYYGGHGIGETGWAPIMGVGYYQNLSQWSKGEYAGANQTQDDLGVITTQNGFGYRTDDHSDTSAGAAVIAAAGAGTLGEGNIERRTDVDVFRINHGGGEISLNVNPFPLGPNLDIKAELYDASGALVATGGNEDLLGATVGANVAAGTYYLHVDGVGKGDPLATGYTDYASLGYYRITQNTAPPVNDGFSSAIALAGNSVSTTGLSLGATKQAGEPLHAGNSGGRSVWWTWTAPANDTYVFDTAGSSFNTLLGVYTGGSVGALTTVASNDDQAPGSILTSRLTLNAVAGTAYRIAVDGFGGLSGNVALTITRLLHNLGGRVFDDRNSNGVVDGSETGTPGRTVYIDGNGNGLFDTGGTTTLHSVDVPKAGIDGNTVLSNLNVSGLGNVTDVNVTLNINHTWVNDLDVFLISPTGTRVELFTDVGADGADNFTNTTLDDEAATSITTAGAPFTGTFRPEGLLSTFDGQSANGTWTLEVTDDFPVDTGTLTAWSLAIAASEQSATTTADGSYTFAGLTAGAYNVRQVLPAGLFQSTPAPGTAHTVTLSGGVGQTGKHFGNFPTLFTGSAGNDFYSVSTAAGGAGVNFQIVEMRPAAPTIIWLIRKATLGATPLTFDTGGGNDTFNVTHVNGNPFSGGAGTLTVNGGDGDDTFGSFGPAAAASITATSAAVPVSGGTVNYSAMETVEVDGLLGLDDVTISGGHVRVPAPQRFHHLSIGAGATATLAPGGAAAPVYTQGLTIAEGGVLDLADTDLLLDYAGSSPTGITGLLQSGRNGGAWDGGSGIVTSMPDAATGLTTLALAEAARVIDFAGAGTALWNGHIVDATTVLVKYTYAGDANLDGAITGDDYSAIDFGILFPGMSGYANGDFNYDGVITGDDYSVIDLNILLQGPPLAPSRSPGQPFFLAEQPVDDEGVYARIAEDTAEPRATT